MSVSSPSDSENENFTDYDFDTNLPSKHSYLGSLRQIFSTPFYAEGEIIFLPFICVPDIVIMPNQEVPLMISSHELDLSQILNESIANIDRHKGFVCMASSCATEDDLRPELFYMKFGTIASVVKMENVENRIDSAAETGVRVIVRGYQRCVLKKSELRIEGFNHRHYGHFRVLSEPGLRPPLKLFGQMPLEWRVPLAQFKQCDLFVADLSSCTQALFFDLDIDCLMEKIKKLMPVWHLGEDHPSDPTEFSYWLAANLPMDAGRRLQLLGAVSVVHRLYALLVMMRKYSQLNCSGCGSQLANVKDINCMNRGKLTAAYINPGGITQELFTVTKVRGVRYHGLPTSEFTWFPGYKWRHLICQRCWSHCGWEYSAENPRTRPSVFCGLKRGDVLPGTDEGTDITANLSEEQEILMTPVYHRE